MIMGIIQNAMGMILGNYVDSNQVLMRILNQNTDGENSFMQKNQSGEEAKNMLPLECIICLYNPK